LNARPRCVGEAGGGRVAYGAKEGGGSMECVSRGQEYDGVAGEDCMGEGQQVGWRPGDVIVGGDGHGRGSGEQWVGTRGGSGDTWVGARKAWVGAGVAGGQTGRRGLADGVDVGWHYGQMWVGRRADVGGRTGRADVGWQTMGRRCGVMGR